MRQPRARGRKPILAIKTGPPRSRSSGAIPYRVIGGDYAAYLAMCERYGICNCGSLDDMVETRSRSRAASAEGAPDRFRHHLGRTSIFC